MGRAPPGDGRVSSNVNWEYASYDDLLDEIRERAGIQIIEGPRVVQAPSQLQPITAGAGVSIGFTFGGWIASPRQFWIRPDYSGGREQPLLAQGWSDPTRTRQLQDVIDEQHRTIRQLEAQLQERSTST
jgi:hypothetical protein